MFLYIVLGLFSLFVGGAVLALANDAIRKLSGSTLILLVGLVMLFAGERWFGESDYRMAVSGVAVLILLGSVALRVYAFMGSQGARKAAHRNALLWTGLSLSSLILYAIATPGSIESFGLDEEAALRWSGSWNSIWPILLAMGLGPALLLDRALALHPTVLPPRASQKAVISGLTTAMAIAMLFPVNYLAAQHDKEWDVAYFRTTKPGSSTVNIVKSLSEPVTATLFFAPGSEVRVETERYFTSLSEQAGNGMLQIKVVDQPLAPKLSEELKIRDNGYVALKQGEEGAIQKFKIGTEMKKARRELRKLDGTVQKNLLKLSRGQKMAYLVVGHDEASPREKEDPLRKLNEFKKLLREQNYKVDNLGAAEGLANEVPDDADVVIVASPKRPLAPEEANALAAYADNGGSLFLLVDPGADPMVELLSKFGLEAGQTQLANSQYFINQRRGRADRVLLATNKFGSHDTVKTLSRNSTEKGLMIPTALAVRKGGDPNFKGKQTTIIRSMPNTWEDVDGDFNRGKEETAKIHEIAWAIEGPDGGPAYRVLVSGDVSVLSDVPLLFSAGNRDFAGDAMRWLSREEEISGEVNKEEDVKIQHTNEDDILIFGLSVVAAPMMVLGMGIVLIRVRRRKK